MAGFPWLMTSFREEWGPNVVSFTNCMKTCEKCSYWQAPRRLTKGHAAALWRDTYCCLTLICILLYRNIELERYRLNYCRLID